MIVGIIVFIIFLFSLYIFAKEDFVFLRKNVTLEQIFNVIFLAVPIALFSARISFTLFHPQWIYLNPLVFFIIPYFPGLFVGGGLVGAIIFFYFYTKNKKIPFFRLLDETALAFLVSASVFFLLSGALKVFMKSWIGLVPLGIGILYFVGFVLAKILFREERWLDGAIGAIGIIMYNLLALLSFTIFIIITRKISIVPEDIFYALFLLFGIALFIGRQHTFLKGQK